MAELTNEFAFSWSRHKIFYECPRKLYWQYYGSWGGWEDEAPASARLAYRLKNIKNLTMLVGETFHEELAEILRRRGHQPRFQWTSSRPTWSGGSSVGCANRATRIGSATASPNSTPSCSKTTTGGSRRADGGPRLSDPASLRRRPCRRSVRAARVCGGSTALYRPAQHRRQPGVVDGLFIRLAGSGRRREHRRPAHPRLENGTPRAKTNAAQLAIYGLFVQRSSARRSIR